jgi:hypothetical protein
MRDPRGSWPALVAGFSRIYAPAGFTVLARLTDNGDQTTNLVRKFQRSQGLHDDGIVGKDTWGTLLELWIGRFTG